MLYLSLSFHEVVSFHQYFPDVDFECRIFLRIRIFVFGHQNLSTPLVEATDKGHTAMVELLLEAGADRESTCTVSKAPFHAQMFPLRIYFRKRHQG
jgi:hypothetical protein